MARTKAWIHRGLAPLLAGSAAVWCGSCGDDKPASTRDASTATSEDAAVSGVDASASDAAPADGGPPDAPIPDATSGDDDAEVLRDAGERDAGPAVLALDPAGNADPSSLFWNDAKQYLLIADNRGNRVWKWSDADGFALVGTTPGTPADPTGQGRDDVGQIVELPNGRIVVTRFGFGTHSAVLWLDPSTGERGAVPELSASRRRISLAETDAGALFGGYFESVPDAGLRGAVTTLSLDDGERDFAIGFAKPVGLLPVGDALLAVDQAKNVIVRLPLGGAPDGGFAPGDAGYPVFAHVPAPDQLASGPDDSVFTGQFRPLEDGGTLAVRQVYADGGVSTFADELTRPSGLAYDPTGRRLFVADSNGQNVRTIRVYAVP